MDAALFPPLKAETPADAPQVEALIARAFGPGRYAKAAERLREGSRPIRSLSFNAREGDRVVGCVRLWPIRVGGTAALLLGPFAVDDAWRGRGLGKALIAHACDAARDAGHALILLVGDHAYFAPLDFMRAPPEVTMPGPVDRRRVLILPLQPGAGEGLAGEVRTSSPHS